ncbi:hypothetical protein FPV67DRAFT_1446313 [Lyophyllum atratum]|nr:hypothetical protein FPV67DRAFT_1446313 [Lyophyllum atratum]
MQLSLSLVLAFFAFFSAVVALPSGHTFMRASCDIGGCVAALAPSVVSCAGAAIKKGADIAKDAACLASAANVVKNLPADCDKCLDEFDVEAKAKSAAKVVGGEIKDTAKAAVSKAKDVAEDAGHVVGKIGSKLGSLF